LSDNEPWKNPDPERVKTILNVSLQICAGLSILCQPFLPFTAEKLRGMLNMGALNWNNARSTNLLTEGHQLSEPVMLFAKVDPALLKHQLAKLETIKAELVVKKQAEEAAQQAREAAQQPKEAPTPANLEAVKPETSFDAFSQMDIRIGTITAAERVPKSDKLLKLTVDTGLDTRTVLSGIAKHFAPENIIGQQVTMLVNLAPRKMMGVESQGMILMAENAAGILSFVVPALADVNNGATVR
jgi:methionyl-tRNA synthetase